MNESARLIHGDCLDPKTGLASLADKSVDHVICDPPYSEHVHKSARSMRGIETGYGDAACAGVRAYDIDFAHIGTDVMTEAARQFARVSRRWVAVFSDTESAHLWRGAMEASGVEYVRTCFWHKLNGAPQFTGDRPAVALEAITLCHPQGKKRWNGGGRQGFYEAAIVLNRGGDNERLHTTQKPLALMEALIRDFTDPGDIICDPFAGSGTTGVAAVHLGRRFIGWERDEKYARIAQERIGSTREQISLFTETTPAKQAGLFAADSEEVA